MNTPKVKCSFGRNLLYFVSFCVLVQVGISAIWIWFSGWDSTAEVARSFGVSLLYSLAIGGLCWGVLARIAPRIWKAHSLVRWTSLLATLLVLALAGTAIASVPAHFLFRVGSSYAGLVREALRTAIPITFLVGVATTAIEAAKSRLYATELKLRTQQLERERAEKLAAEAQLGSLASRVQPHFLFNTLNSVTELIHQDPRQAERMIEQLSSLLRSSLDSTETVTLEREMKLVADYLEIQSARLGGRLRYDLDIPPDGSPGAASVPPFAVQTLVENSLKHVAGQRQEGVDLHVHAERSNGDLVVDVTDDGPGFGPESIRAGHGLENLRSRLHVLYGERAALELLPGAGRMTVRLRVPAA